MRATNSKRKKFEGYHDHFSYLRKDEVLVLLIHKDGRILNIRTIIDIYLLFLIITSLQDTFTLQDAKKIWYP